jgi:hypothetical protein
MAVVMVVNSNDNGYSSKKVAEYFKRAAGDRDGREQRP